MAKIKRNKSPKSLLSKNKTQSSGKILNGGIALMAIFLVGFIFSFSTKIIQNGIRLVGLAQSPKGSK